MTVGTQVEMVIVLMRGAAELGTAAAELGTTTLTAAGELGTATAAEVLLE